MRKISSLKLLVGMAVFSCAGLLMAGTDFPSLQKVKVNGDHKETTGTLSITKKDVDVEIKGRVRQDWLLYDKIYTLRASNDDQLSAFRSKASVDFKAKYGRQRYGRSAADAKIRLTNYGYWQYESYYTPFANGERPLTMLTYMEEMWTNMHLGTFFNAYDNWFSFDKHPVDVKIGYFPYQLGRGISLGDAGFIHIPYLGLDSNRADDTRFNPPGILIHGTVNKDITYDLYYSKQGENSISRSLTWEKIHENRTDGRRAYRGIAKDRDIWAAKMDFNHKKSWGKTHVQPYMMYMDSPETSIEFTGDSSLRLGTVGMMAEYKKGRFAVNAEVAGQFGHQNVYAIDRNQQETAIDSATGLSTSKHTHIFMSSSISANQAYVNNTATKENVNSLANRGGYDETTKQWVPAVTKNGDTLTDVACYYPTFVGADDWVEASELYNSNVTGNARFRDAYRVDYRGFMGVVDAKYEFEDVPVTIMAAGAYISGDRYPYNTEENKRFNGFVPYGDYDYIGKYVTSHIVLEARKLPRPVDISFHHQYAFNNVKDAGNLAYIGTGAEWRPFKEKEKLLLKSNLLWYWEATTLKKWGKTCGLPEDNEGNRTFVGNETWPVKEVGNEYIWSSGDHYIGWQKDENASRHLGTELNFEMQYRPVKNCILLAQLACFIPGQLYKDLDGQPNERTKDGPLAAVGVYGLGHDPVWRAAMSLDYRF